MNDRQGIAFSHVCISVSDFEASERFYTEGLNFELDYHVTAGQPFEKLTELPDLNMRGGFYMRDGMRLEIMHIESPGVVGSKERRAINQLGLSHMSLIVADLDAVVDRIERYGGHAHRHTKVEGPLGDMMFCTDPDGIRIELWEKQG